MGWVTAYLFGHFFIYLHFFVLSKNCLKGEWTKNGGIWGEEIFCPRANRFFLPAARGRRALDFSEISDKISSSRVVNILKLESPVVEKQRTEGERQKPKPRTRAELGSGLSRTETKFLVWGCLEWGSGDFLPG
ncbi:MAG: hypothetical protein AUJ24_01535 [Parcubacteria group bacterium CG1_02_36_42]|nr:MAG: hypothetical protein AUJ24_01535 [Parcubacteria group bacterium CG1_02_36_42]